MTNQSCLLGGGCMVMGIAKFVLWWLIASGLLMLTWNKVIGALTQVKKANYRQALLLVATVAAFALPCKMMQRSSMGHQGGCGAEKSCHHAGKESGDCCKSHHECHSDCASKEKCAKENCTHSDCKECGHDLKNSNPNEKNPKADGRNPSGKKEKCPYSH